MIFKVRIGFNVCIFEPSITFRWNKSKDFQSIGIRNVNRESICRLMLLWFVWNESSSFFYLFLLQNDLKSKIADANAVRRNDEMNYSLLILYSLASLNIPVDCSSSSRWSGSGFDHYTTAWRIQFRTTRLWYRYSYRRITLEYWSKTVFRSIRFY